MRKILLSIAGYNPTSGAGVLLDLKVFEHFGFQGMAILTSITSQNTNIVKRVHYLPPDFLWNQYQTLYDGKKFQYFKKEKIEKKVHGTGCFLSSSLLAYLVKGNSLEKACSLSTQLTHKAIKNAARIGRGQNTIHFS